MTPTRKQFIELLQQIVILRFPRHRIATFGETEIRYSLVSPVSHKPPQAVLRTGLLSVKRPRLLTRESLARRFHGFGDDAGAYEKWFLEGNGEAFRAMEYQFHNRLDNVQLHHIDARALSDTVSASADERASERAVVISAPENGWQFALMKFILEETVRSFRSNFQELEERGLLDPAENARAARRRDIEALFQAAQKDRAAIDELGRTLKSFGLFEDYQDRFFELVRRP